MKKGVFVVFLLIFSLAFVLAEPFGGPGNEMGPDVNGQDSGWGAPSAEEMECMQTCVAIGCEAGDKNCTISNSVACGEKCGVDVDGPPEPADESEACMQKCILVGCDEFDFVCKEQNKKSCDIKCGMKGDAPDESEMNKEQKCISECAMKKDPEVICGNSKEGETGGRICKKCAKKCEHLYEGPCLNDKQIKKKEKECKTCKHCYGEPVEGASGQGWDCIINIECKDASGEFGDNPGEGPGIGQEGYENKERLGKKIGGFFKGLFGGNK